MSVLRRATSYGLAIPAYGVLFTAVSREEKYKARPFIDRSSTGAATWWAAGSSPALLALGARAARGGRGRRG